LEQSFEQLKRFTSDASHELRTPLAVMRSVGEVGLQKETTAAGYRDIIGSMLEETNKLTRLVEFPAINYPDCSTAFIVWRKAGPVARAERVWGSR
jgi:hypothetical protein